MREWQRRSSRVAAVAWVLLLLELGAALILAGAIAGAALGAFARADVFARVGGRGSGARRCCW